MAVLDQISLTSGKGNINLSSEFVENGMIITINLMGIELPGAKATDPPVITNYSKRFVFTGSPSSMLSAITTQLGLSKLFKI